MRVWLIDCPTWSTTQNTKLKKEKDQGKNGEQLRGLFELDLPRSANGLDNVCLLIEHTVRILGILLVLDYLSSLIYYKLGYSGNL